MEESDDLSAGAFLFVTVAALSVGMILSAVRWFFVDHFLYWLTCLPRPTHTFAKLKDPGVLEAFKGLNDNHYRYYQYYANTLTAMIVGLICLELYGSSKPMPKSIWFVGAGLILVLLIAARDALSKFNARAAQLLT